MNWEALGAAAELLAAVGVVASLAYLGLQIRQNSALLAQTAETTRANAAVTSGNLGAGLLVSIALDADLARIWRLGQSEPKALNVEEASRFRLLMIAQVIQMDVNYALLRSGGLDEDIHAIWDRQLDRWLGHPDFRALWDEGGMQSIVSGAFASRVKMRLDAEHA